MELKEFIKKALIDIVTGIKESEIELSRTINIVNAKEYRGIEFEVAVTSEGKGSGNFGIKVLEVIEVGNVEASYKNESVSKIKFGVFVSAESKEEVNRSRQELINLGNQ